MALHAVDKNSLDRGAPTPNTHDKVFDTGGVMSKGTTSVSYIQQGNQNFAGAGFKNQSNLGQFVQSATVQCTWSNANPEQVFTVAHGLGYAPFPLGILNGSTVSAGFSANEANQLSIPLPTWLNFTISGGIVTFSNWVQMMSDSSNVYIYLLNGNLASSGTIVVTYYLYKQAVLNA